MAPRRRGGAAAALGALWLAAAVAMQVFGFVGQEVAREGRVKPTDQPHDPKEAVVAGLAERALAAKGLPPKAQPPVSKHTEAAAAESPKAKDATNALLGADVSVAFASAARALPRRGRGALRAVPGGEEAHELLEANTANMRAAEVPDKLCRGLRSPPEDCLSEGCPLDVAEEIAAKLARDESRLWTQYQHSRRAEASEVDEGSWMDGVLLSIHDAREHLEDLVGQRHSGYVAFGSGQTGGFFRAPAH